MLTGLRATNFFSTSTYRASSNFPRFAPRFPSVAPVFSRSQVNSACSTPASSDRRASLSFPWITGSRSGNSGMRQFPLALQRFLEHQVKAEDDLAQEDRRQENNCQCFFADKIGR